MCIYSLSASGQMRLHTKTQLKLIVDNWGTGLFVTQQLGRYILNNRRYFIEEKPGCKSVFGEKNPNCYGLLFLITKELVLDWHICCLYLSIVNVLTGNLVPCFFQSLGTVQPSVFKHTEISNCFVCCVFLEACHCADLALEWLTMPEAMSLAFHMLAKASWAVWLQKQYYCKGVRGQQSGFF